MKTVLKVCYSSLILAKSHLLYYSFPYSFLCIIFYIALTVTDVTVSAEIARKCLESVPIKKNKALDILDTTEALIQWHSNLDYLSNPPKGYQSPAVDLVSTLRTIRGKVQKDEYPGEIAFEEDLVKWGRSAHDDLFKLSPDVMDTFKFKRDEIGDIVAISPDEDTGPQIYVLRKFLFSFFLFYFELYFFPNGIHFNLKDILYL